MCIGIKIALKLYTDMKTTPSLKCINIYTTLMLEIYVRRDVHRREYVTPRGLILQGLKEQG